MTCLTEDQIERRVEKMTDALDAQLMAGAIDQPTYDSKMRDLARWADSKHFANKRIGSAS